MDKRVNAAFILKLIRDEKVKGWNDIRRYFPLAFVSSKETQERKKIQSILSHLLDAGLIMNKGSSFSVTPLVEKVQMALDISLSDLSNYGPDSVTAQPIFGKPEPANELRDVFVLMPFSEELKPVYEDHIKEVCLELNLSVERADDFFAATSIISDVWNAIYNSRIIIADCTGRNPNVFYEIGIAHTIGRPTILIAQDRDDIPFDIGHLRFLLYKYTPRGMKEVSEKLKQTLVTEVKRLDRYKALDDKY